MSQAPDRRLKRAALLAAKKRTRSEIRLRDRLEAEARQEAADEAIAPAIQRLGAPGVEPRLVRDGVSFRVASPVLRLCQMGARRSSRGDEPTINIGHVRAADRLRVAWEISQTVTFGTSSYGDGRGGGDCGVLSQTVLNGVNRQIDAGRAVAGARAALGVLWGVVEAVALRGVPVGSWAARERLEPASAAGFLRAGLDVLGAHWGVVDGVAGRSRIRAVQVGEMVG